MDKDKLIKILSLIYCGAGIAFGLIAFSTVAQIFPPAFIYVAIGLICKYLIYLIKKEK